MYGHKVALFRRNTGHVIPFVLARGSYWGKYVTLLHIWSVGVLLERSALQLIKYLDSISRGVNNS